MNLINKRLAGELFMWAEKNADRDVFAQINEEVSYYINRESEDTYIMEYSLNTAAEVKKELETYSGISSDAELAAMLTVGICQSKLYSKENRKLESTDMVNAVKEAENRSEIPEYIYVF